jgi:serine/threonine-protein kinase
MLLELRPPGNDQLSCAIHNFAEQRLNDLWVETTSFDVLSTSRDWPNLGVAHGWAGLLYVTLRWHILTGDTQPASFHDRLDQLLRAARPNGRGVSWPWRQNAGDPDLATMPGWCNGSAGMVHLASLAHRVLKDDFCVQLSEAAAWHVWEAGAGPVDLCCGYAGRAYALLEVYRMTGNRRWLEKAQALAMRAARAAPEMRIPDHPRHSLYKGELGLALLIADLECPMEAAMPLFASEG